jgi:hypothetical protein
VNGRWSIPSHDGYPADAQDQLASAAAAVMDVVKGPKVTDRRADHELYGVVDPARAETGATGVGTRVTLEASGAGLVDLIIGKEVKDAPQLRYVRLPGTDRVYTAAVSTANLTTRFEDWIEDDLLRLEADEVSRVLVNSYSVDEINRRITPGEQLLVTFDDESRQWSLEGLGASETLDQARLNEMRRAVDDLRIVDVLPKPEGLGRELRTAETLQLDAVAVSSLSNRGFYIVDGRLVSNQGDVYVGLETGVEYVLRFGEIALGAREGERLGDEDDDAAEPDDGGANRYLFVMAQFNPDLVPAPELETLPDVIGAPPADTPPGEPPVGADHPPGAGGGADAGTGDDPPAPHGPSAAQDPPATTEPPADPVEPPVSDAPTLDEALQLAREEMARRNAAAVEAHQKKLEAAREKVRELNDRFADWYYVIPNDVYEKIRMRRADIVEVGEAEDAGVEGPVAPGG